ncbi:MAG: cyclic nucleotide-binding domain-containing protein [Parvibaculaceae bacterium]
MSVRGDVDLLRQTPLFASVDGAQLQLLVFSAERRRVAPGQSLLRKGESANAGLLVLEGEAEAYSGRSGRPVALIERGAFLGELQMIAKVPSSISVRAKTDMHLMAIGHDLFMRVCSEFPEAGGKMLNVLSRKLDASMKDLRVVQRYFEGARAAR